MKFKGNFGELILNINGTEATGTYQQNGTLKGEFINNTFKGQWENKGMEGLVEFTITDDKLEGNWKKGLEPGPMKGKWEGKLVDSLLSNKSNTTNDLSPEQKSFLEGGFSSWDFKDEEKVPKEWLNSKAFMLGAVKSDGSILEYASEELKSDSEIVLEAVKTEGRALEYASDALKSDREIVLEAVKSDGSALEYASEALKSDREIVLEAIKSDPYGDVFKSVSEGLKSDREIILEAVKSNERALEYVSEDILKRLDFIKDLCEVIDWKRVIENIPFHVIETADESYIVFFEAKCKEGIEVFRNELSNLKFDDNNPQEYKNKLESIYKKNIPFERYYPVSKFRWDGKINFNEGEIQYYGEDSAYEVLCNEFYQNIWQPAMERAELAELVKLIPPTIEYNKYAFMPNRELTLWGYERVINFLDNGEELSLEQLVELLNAEEEFFHLSSDLPEIHERLVEELFKHSFQDIFEEILYNDYHWGSSIFTKNRNRLEEFIEWIRDKISSTNDDKYDYPLENLLEWLAEADES